MQGVWGGVNNTYFEVMNVANPTEIFNISMGSDALATFVFSPNNDWAVYSIIDLAGANTLQLQLWRWDYTQSDNTKRMQLLSRADDKLSRQRVITFNNWAYVAAVLVENSRISFYGADDLHTVVQKDFPTMAIDDIYDETIVKGFSASHDTQIGMVFKGKTGATETSMFWLLQVNFDSCLDRENSTLVCTRCPVGYYLDKTYIPQNKCIKEAKGIRNIQVNNGASVYNITDFTDCKVSNCARCADDFNVCDYCTTVGSAKFFLKGNRCDSFSQPKGFNVTASPYLNCRDPNCADCEEDYRQCTKCKPSEGKFTFELVLGTCSPVEIPAMILSNNSEVFNNKLTITFSDEIFLEYSHLCSEYPNKDQNYIPKPVSCCPGNSSTVYFESNLFDKDLNASYACDMYTCTVNRSQLIVQFDNSLQIYNGVFNLSIPKCHRLRLGPNKIWPDFTYSRTVRFHSQWKGTSDFAKQLLQKVLYFKWWVFLPLVWTAPFAASISFKAWSYLKLMSLLQLGKTIYAQYFFEVINNSGQKDINWRDRSAITKKVSQGQTLVYSPSESCRFPQLPFTESFGCGLYESLNPELDFAVLCLVIALGGEIFAWLSLIIFEKWSHLGVPLSDEIRNHRTETPSSTKIVLWVNQLCRNLLGLNMIMSILDGFSPIFVYYSVSSLMSIQNSSANLISFPSRIFAYCLLIYYCCQPLIVKYYREFQSKSSLPSTESKSPGYQDNGELTPLVKTASAIDSNPQPSEKLVYNKIWRHEKFSILYLQILSESSLGAVLKLLQFARDLSFPLAIYFEQEALTFMAIQIVYLALIGILLVYRRRYEYSVETAISIVILLFFIVNWYASLAEVSFLQRELLYAQLFIRMILGMAAVLAIIFTSEFLQLCIMLLKLLSIQFPKYDKIKLCCSQIFKRVAIPKGANGAENRIAELQPSQQQANDGQ